jgi:cytochrome P450
VTDAQTHPAERSNLRDLWDSLIDDPYPFYARLRGEAPVWRIPGTDAYWVSTWDLVAEASGRVEDFSNRFRHTIFTNDDGSIAVIDGGETGAAAIPDVFAGADPPEHTLHRKVFFPELLQTKMQQLEPDISAFADRLIDDVLDRRHVDAAAQLANPLPIRVAAEWVIGFRDTNLDAMQRWVFAGSS